MIQYYRYIFIITTIYYYHHYDYLQFTIYFTFLHYFFE
jgi:hypothetical protein